MADWDPAATWNREDQHREDQHREEPDVNDEPAFDEEPTEEFFTEEEEPAAPAPARPIERFKKRRVVFGVAFLVLGLAGAISDLFSTNAGTALTISSLTGAVVLLGSLVLGARRNANLFSQTPISHPTI